MSEVPEKGNPPDTPVLPGPEDTAGRQRLPSQGVSPLLQHLLDCGDTGDERECGDGGTLDAWSGDAYLEAAATEALIRGEVESKEQWYREAGVLTRFRNGVISAREAKADPGMAYFKDRYRRNIRDALVAAELLPETETDED